MFAYITQDNTISFLSFEILPEEIQDGFTTEQQEGGDGEQITVEVPNMVPNPAIAGLTPIEYDWTIITDPVVVDGEIVQRPHIESEQEKFDRVFSNIIALDTLDETTDQSVLEWLTFSDTAIGDVIANRVFKDEMTGKGNPHWQMAMMAKIIANPAYATTPEVIAKLQAINNIRVFFGLSSITP